MASCLEGILWHLSVSHRLKQQSWGMVKVSFTPITSAQIDFLCTNDHVASQVVAIKSGTNGFTPALIHSDIGDNPLPPLFLIYLFCVMEGVFFMAFLLRCNLLGFVPRWFDIMSRGIVCLNQWSVLLLLQMSPPPSQPPKVETRKQKKKKAEECMLNLMQK